ncbi:ABC transporter substrate-binding protein [Lentzea albidocapillata]|uniref:Peptide/nickel transport system substrate-binding protein n=1 Tax=Lentzea albidocapillata TaxID=40571 RepID=A0A1W2DGZ0_9PSEU|nr:ABC transporter substrate-binding protein [Lentzea albidocapillata]SMC96246.1 peptide/nickel transport system substrate-binding protein [Lentzea albidocapillata]
MIVSRKARRRGLALAVVAVFALAGCTGGNAASTAPPPNSEADIDPDAILRFSSAAPLPLLDPVLQPSYGLQGYLALVYDRLTMIDKDNRVIPGLATEWKFAPDGTHLEVKLRSDVKFHDGTVFDAAAVKANIDRGKNFPGSTVKAALADITAVEVVDPTTVRLALAKGTGVQLPSSLATNAGMMVSPKAIGDPASDLSSKPGNAGSGPYVVSEFVPQEKLVVKKAPGYWDPKAGRLAGIQLERVPEASTRLKGVQTGQTDLSYVSSANDLAQAKQLSETGQLNFLPVTYRNVIGVYLRAGRGDLVKPEVRQAIAHAIDPEAVNALFSGMCAPHRQLHPDGEWPAIKNYKYPYGFDAAKAKSLVTAAGGAKVDITFAAGTNAEQPANVVQGALAAAGIDANLNPVPNSESEARFIAGDFELLVASSMSPKIDPADTVNTFLLGTYKLAAKPALVQDLAAEAGDPALSQEQRAPLYERIWATTLEEAWYVPICRLTNAAISNNKVMFVDDVPWADIGIWDLRNVAMRKG